MTQVDQAQPGPADRQRPRRRRFPRIVGAGIVFTLVASAIASIVWFQAGATVFKVIKTDTAEHHWTPDKPLFVLLLGEDSRPGAGCGCTDAIHVVGVPAGGGKATMLDIPRDTRVAVPGHGNRRINEAYGLGGPVLTAQVVGELVGLNISYVIVTGFTSFPSMVDEIGGVKVNLPVSIRDSGSGANFSAGEHVLAGAGALAYVRSRHIAGGDFARTGNQGTFIIDALAGLRAKGAGPLDTVKNLAILLRHTDTVGMGTADLYRLGRLAMSIEPANVRNVVMPGLAATISGASYVVTVKETGPLFADFADDALLQTH